MKFCNKWQTLKTEMEFHRNKIKRDGLRHCCKACVSTYNPNYTNLQPLWAKDNLSKGAKV